MTSWLAKQRKAALIDLSSEAGLQQDDDLRKDEIVEALDAYLQQHATRLSRNETFDGYYGLRRTPYKARSSSTAAITSGEDEVKSVVKGRGRRATKVKEEFEEDTATLSPGPSRSTALIPSDPNPTRRTPGRPRRHTQPQLPPSPADVANLAELESTRLYAGLNDLYTVSGFPQAIDYLRETCSSLTSLQYLLIGIESFGISRTVLPWKLLTTLVIARDYVLPIYYPDLFVVLTPEFWRPVLLYLFAAILVPALFGYFFNLTTYRIRRHGVVVSAARHEVDPLIFNVVKGLSAFMLYTPVGYQEADYLGRLDTWLRVKYYLTGGDANARILIGCYIMIACSLYEAAQTGRR